VHRQIRHQLVGQHRRQEIGRSTPFSTPQVFSRGCYQPQPVTPFAVLGQSEKGKGQLNIHAQITPELSQFIFRQHLFFVASAPLAREGHINLSPKGLDSFCVLSPQQVAYLDLVGSGNETSAHLRENGRITFMFCAFDGPPNILRLYGTGHTVLPTHSTWEGLSQKFPLHDFTGVRQIIVADITRVQTSCGFGVPLYQYQGQRDLLPKWAAKKTRAGLQAYMQEKNLTSIDGLASDLAADHK
jgi:hypothetical protein